MKTQLIYIRKIGDSIARMATAIVSAMPGQKIVLKPRNESSLQYRKEFYKSGSEKHYHRPMSKPVVEKQTLLKEKKKTKVVR